MNNLEILEEKIGYKFKNANYLKVAVTHSSYANESKSSVQCNERQEFLGDAVLSIIVSTYIFRHCPKLPEGDLTKLRASLVCEKSLAKYAKSLNLGSHLLLSKGERLSGGADRPSILADAFEALIAAIYLDGGMKNAERFVLGFVVDDIKTMKPKRFTDYKTRLQEIVQKNPDEKIEYILVKESGPDHDKRFLVEVRLNDNNIIGKGGGKSKKSAEQEAAKRALELMGY